VLQALQTICPREKYENALLSNEITRLEERRRDHCINLVSDLSEEEHKLHHLLPPRKCQIITRNTRSIIKIFFITLIVGQIDLSSVQYRML
jgi:hypothetical protein